MYSSTKLLCGRLRYRIACISWIDDCLAGTRYGVEKPFQLPSNFQMSEVEPIVDDEALLKEFFTELGSVERDNEVNRVLSCFKLNPFEHLNLPFDSEIDEVKRQYRKISLMIHPDKCSHPQAKEAFAVLAKAQQTATDPDERKYLLSVFNIARDELRSLRKKEMKKDSASRIKSTILETKEEDYEKSSEFQEKWKMRVREIMTENEWRRRKMQLRIAEEEKRVQKEEEEEKEVTKRKRDHEKKWEDTRETRVSSWRNFTKGGKKVKKGELKPPKLKTEDPERSYVQRPVKRG